MDDWYEDSFLESHYEDRYGYPDDDVYDTGWRPEWDDDEDEEE